MNPEWERQVSDWYGNQPFGLNPEGYWAFNREITRQYHRLTEHLDVTFTPSDPYTSNSGLWSDCEKGKLKVFSAGEHDPAMGQDIGQCWRAIHDFHGHYMPRASFRSLDGEVKAFQAQVHMFPEESWPVLAASTLGQICWFYHGANRQFDRQRSLAMPEYLWRWLVP